MRARKGVDLDVRGDGEDLEGVEGREAIIRISCLKKSVFNKRKRSTFKIIFFFFIFSLTLLFLKYLYQTFLYMLD